jgi:hypothetical protein
LKTRVRGIPGASSTTGQHRFMGAGARIPDGAVQSISAVLAANQAVH